MWVYQGLFLLSGSGSKFPEVDPDPAKWYGSDRIRIRNTAWYAYIFINNPRIGEWIRDKKKLIRSGSNSSLP